MAKNTNNKPNILIVAGIMAWIIPGAGHWVGGRKKQGITIFVGVFGAFLLGILLGSIEVIDPQYHSMWFIAQILNGLPAVLTAVLQDSGTAMFAGPKGSELGQVYTSIAGLLNLFCIIDAIAPDVKTSNEGIL
ncbi:MAG: hypothetical protein JEZ07_11110 [Phycisphaerae bacterium]|nr:hypothetical protein [Phycisphaerae bacterium]